MKFVIVLLCSLIAVSPFAPGQTMSLKGASVSEDNFGIFLDVSYRLPKTRLENLVTLRARVTLVTSEQTSYGKRFKRTDLQCEHSEKLMKAVQNQSFDNNLEGMMLSLDCQPRAHGANLLSVILVANEIKKRSGQLSSPCPEEALGTSTVATIPVGRDVAICFEDWSRVDDPVNRFVAEYEKRHSSSK